MECTFRKARLKSLQKELPAVLKKVGALLARGARDVVFEATGATQRHGLAMVCSMSYASADLSPLLKVLLEANLTPPVDASAAYESVPGMLVCPLFHAIQSGHVSYVRLLVEHGASLMQPCMLHTTTGQSGW